MHTPLAMRVRVATPDVALVFVHSTLRDDMAAVVQVATVPLCGKLYTSLYVVASMEGRQVEVLWRLPAPIPAHEGLQELLVSGAIEHRLVPRVLAFLEASANGTPSEPLY